MGRSMIPMFDDHPIIPLGPRALSRRVRVPEWMDQPSLAPDLHANALVGLARLNWLGGAAKMLRPWLASLPDTPDRPMTLVDAACGGGDILAAVHRMFPGKFRLFGVDSSAGAIEQSRKRALPGAVLEQADLFGPWPAGIPSSPDIIVSSLFLHHLDPGQVEQLLRDWAGRAQRMVLISDLRRSAIDWWLIWAASRLVTRSPVVHRDSALSVQGAYTRSELRAMLQHAGLACATISYRFPCRWVIAWTPEAQK